MHLFILIWLQIVHIPTLEPGKFTAGMSAYVHDSYLKYDDSTDVELDRLPGLERKLRRLFQDFI